MDPVAVTDPAAEMGPVAVAGPLTVTGPRLGVGIELLRVLGMFRNMNRTNKPTATQNVDAQQTFAR